MKIKNYEVQQIGSTVSAILNSYTPHDNLTPLRFAVFALDSAIAVHYNSLITKINLMFNNSVELDEKGVPKKKAKLIGINGKEESSEEYLWKEGAQEKFQKENEKLLMEEVEIDFPKFNLCDILEGKPKLQEGYQTILKYIV